MRIISTEDIICLEYHNRSATYYVDKLKLSTLLLKIVEEATKNILDLTKIQILTYTLTHIPFIRQEQIVQIIDNVIRCLKSQRSSMFRYGNFIELQEILEIDYEINGSFIVFEDGETEWYLDISILLPN